MDGRYRRNDQRSNHDIVIYGSEQNYYWKCLDTYDNTKKKLAWDFGFSMVKEYTLDKNVVVETAWQTFLRLLREWLGV